MKSLRAVLVETGPFSTQSPPVGLATLAAVLRRQRVESRILDEAVLPDAWPALEAELRSGTPPDLVGFGAKTPGFTRVIELSRRVRALSPATRVVVGGIHATALPERSLEESGADAVVLGEAEDTLPELTDALLAGRDLGGVAGIVHRGADGSAVRTAARAVRRDLDELPLPAWDLIGDFADYSRRPWQVLRRGTRIAPVLTTRGCPFECTFCAVSTIVGRALRRRSPEAVVEEIRWLKRDFGVDELHIIDDVFNVNLRHAKAVCEAIVRAGVATPFKTPNGLRADYVDDELVDLMRRAGCWQIGLGVESADGTVLDGTRKRLELGAVAEAVERFHRAGISVFGYFILGLPGDTEERARASLGRMRRIPFDHVHVSYCVPYPGTEIFEQQGGARIFGDVWRSYAHHNTFPTSQLSARALRRLMRLALFGFYLRPTHAWRLLVDSLRGGFTPILDVGLKYLGGVA